MSVAAITAAWKVECEPTQKLVLLALADHADDEHYKCWPSLTHLCRKTGLGRSTMARALKHLESDRLIGRVKRGTKTTMYRLNVANWSRSGTSAESALVPEEDGGSAAEGPEVVPQRDGGSATAGHGTVSESSTEPSVNRKGRCDARFDEFWEAYPSKKAKKPARDKWKQKKLDDKADQIIADVRDRAARDRQWLDGYIPNPATYLSQERWEDGWKPVDQPAKKQKGELDGASPV